MKYNVYIYLYIYIYRSIDRYTVHVTSNLQVSVGLLCRESAKVRADGLLISTLWIGRVASAAREKLCAEVGTIYTLVTTSHL